MSYNLRLTFLIFCCIALSSFAGAQPNNFLKTFVAAPVYTVTQPIHNFTNLGLDTLSSNAFVLSGFYRRFGTSKYDTLLNDGFLVKNEISGQTKWFRKFHVANRELMLVSVNVLKNNDILAFGRTVLNNVPDGAMLLTDSNGIAKTFRIFSNNVIESSLVLANGDIAVLSHDINHDLKLTLFDAFLTQKWCTKYTYPLSSPLPLPLSTIKGGLKLVEGKNSSILILGFSDYFNGFMILTDHLGKKVRDMHTSGKYFSNAVYYPGKGYLICGTEINSSAHGILLRADDSLNVDSYTRYTFGNNHSLSFSDIALYDRQKLLLFISLTKDFSLYRHAGMAFIDTGGTFERGFLLTEDTLDAYSSAFKMLKAGRILYTLGSGGVASFGLTDTSAISMCKYTPVSFSSQKFPANFVPDSFITANSTLLSTIFPIHPYNPHDATIEYACGNGPSGPLDTLSPPNLTKIGGLSKNGEIHLYPNPANDAIFINWKQDPQTSAREESKIELTNLLGETVSSIQELKSNVLYRLDTRELANGVYFLNLNIGEGQQVVKKLIISH